MELMAQRGLDGTSMDAIAEESGVSKATIYKHWSNKDALMLEVMAEVNELNTRPKFDSGNTRADMIAVLAYRPEERTGLRERIMPHLIAYAARNVEFGDAWRNLVMEPPRRELKHLLKVAVDKGELVKDLNLELSLAILLGPMIYWYVLLRKKVSVPNALAEGVVDTFWRAYGKKTTAASKAQVRAKTR